MGKGIWVCGKRMWGRGIQGRENIGEGGEHGDGGEEHGEGEHDGGEGEYRDGDMWVEEEHGDHQQNLGHTTGTMDHYRPLQTTMDHYIVYGVAQGLLRMG